MPALLADLFAGAWAPGAGAEGLTAPAARGADLPAELRRALGGGGAARGEAGAEPVGGLEAAVLAGWRQVRAATAQAVCPRRGRACASLYFRCCEAPRRWLFRM